MNTPPLPPAFGNYALENFVEVVPPPDVSWWPQTAGWAWLGTLLLALLLRRGWRRLRRWHANRYRREAAAALRRLAETTPRATPIADVNRLLKLTALAAYPRPAVASLWGPAWVRFLNQQCAAPPFDERAGQQLADGGYRGQAIEDTAREQLLAACQNWIDTHRRASSD